MKTVKISLKKFKFMYVIHQRSLSRNPFFIKYTHDVHTRYYTMIYKFMSTVYCNFRVKILCFVAKLSSMKEASQNDVKSTVANNTLPCT